MGSFETRYKLWLQHLSSNVVPVLKLTNKSCLLSHLLERTQGSKVCRKVATAFCWLLLHWSQQHFVHINCWSDPNLMLSLPSDSYKLWTNQIRCFVICVWFISSVYMTMWLLLEQSDQNLHVTSRSHRVSASHSLLKIKTWAQQQCQK